MDGYLVDTTVISALYDRSRSDHRWVRERIARLPDEAPHYVSAVIVGELRFGVELVRRFRGRELPKLEAMIREMERARVLDVTKHTAWEYGRLKRGLAETFLQKALRSERPRWLEDWVDKATGRRLQVDENDLWQASQASERNLVLLTTDARMRRIQQANPSSLRIEVLAEA